jgi:hypothetical protein
VPRCWARSSLFVLTLTIACSCKSFDEVRDGAGGEGTPPDAQARDEGHDSGAEAPRDAEAGASNLSRCASEPGALRITFDQSDMPLAADYFEHLEASQPEVSFALVPPTPPRIFRVQASSSSYIDPKMLFPALPFTTDAVVSTRFRETQFDTAATGVYAFSLKLLDSDDAGPSGSLEALVSYARGTTTLEVVGLGEPRPKAIAQPPIGVDAWTVVELQLTVSPPQVALFLDGVRATRYVPLPIAAVANKRVARTRLEMRTYDLLAPSAFEFDDVCMSVR